MYITDYIHHLCAVTLYCHCAKTFSLDEGNDGPIIETLYEEENEPEYLGEVSGEDIDC